MQFQDRLNNNNMVVVFQVCNHRSIHFVFIYLQLYIVSDYLNKSFYNEKLFEKELINEGTYSKYSNIAILYCACV